MCRELGGGRQADGNVPVKARHSHLRTSQGDSEIIHVDAPSPFADCGINPGKRKTVSYRVANEATSRIKEWAAVLIGLLNNDWTGRLVQTFALLWNTPQME